MSHNMNNCILVSESSEGSKQNLGKIFGTLALIYFCSTIGGAFFVNRTGYDHRIYFMIFLGIYLINWLNNIIFITDTKKVQEKKIERKVSPKKSWRKMFSNPKVQTAMIFLTVDFFIWETSLSVLNAGLQSQYGFTLEDLAFFQIFSTISCMVFQIPGGKLTDKLGKRKILIFSETCGIVIFILFIVTAVIYSAGNEAFAFTSMILIKIVIGVMATTFIPSESMILTNLDESRKGESFGMVSCIRGIGAIPTGILGGFLMGSVHFVAPFIFSLIGLLFLIGFLIKYGHRFEEVEKQAPILDKTVEI